MELIRDDQGYVVGMTIDIPTAAYNLISGNAVLKQSLVKAAKTVALGRFGTNDPDIKFRVMLITSEEDWIKIAREMIVNYKGDNQATISKKIFLRERKEMLAYNEASYASQSEIRIAQELEQREVLFFPLAMGVRLSWSLNWCHGEV